MTKRRKIKSKPKTEALPTVDSYRAATTAALQAIVERLLPILPFKDLTALLFDVEADLRDEECVLMVPAILAGPCARVMIDDGLLAAIEQVASGQAVEDDE